VTETRSPVDRLLDVVVYAPLGVAAQVVEELPQLAQRGRDTVAGPGAMYRSVGLFAMQQARNMAERHAGGVHDLLTSVGFLSPRGTASGDEDASETEPETGGFEADQVDPVARFDQTAADSASVGDVGISGYDTRPAAEVVPLLAELSAEQRAAVRAHESAGRGRRTILGRLDQLDQLDGAG